MSKFGSAGVDVVEGRSGCELRHDAKNRQAAVNMSALMLRDMRRKN
jgi:hypothetical protein